jgi:hypothetical protein
MIERSRLKVAEWSSFVQVNRVDLCADFNDPTERESREEQVQALKQKSRRIGRNRGADIPLDIGSRL